MATLRQASEHLVSAPESGGGSAGQRKTRGSRVPTGLLFVLPFFLVYVMFLIVPVLLGFRLSFFNSSLVGTGTSEFLGLQNFRELFSDPSFWNSLWHTVLFTLLSTPILVGLALFLAILTNRAVPARWFFRLAFFAPYMLPSSVAALIWVWMFQPGFGLVNSYLTGLGLPEVDWLTNPNVAMLSVVITTVWWTLGFNFVLYLAGLQEIPQELYDASAVDGAGGLAQTFRITIPLLGRTTLLIVALQLFASLNVFDQVYVMSTNGGLNAEATRPIVQYIYEQGFTSYRVGFASAMSYVFFLLVLAGSIAQFFVIGRRRNDA